MSESKPWGVIFVAYTLAAWTVVDYFGLSHIASGGAGTVALKAVVVSSLLGAIAVAMIVVSAQRRRSWVGVSATIGIALLVVLPEAGIETFGVVGAGLVLASWILGHQKSLWPLVWAVVGALAIGRLFDILWRVGLPYADTWAETVTEWGGYDRFMVSMVAIYVGHTVVFLVPCIAAALLGDRVDRLVSARAGRPKIRDLVGIGPRELSAEERGVVYGRGLVVVYVAVAIVVALTRLAANLPTSDLLEAQGTVCLFYGMFAICLFVVLAADPAIRSQWWTVAALAATVVFAPTSLGLPDMWFVSLLIPWFIGRQRALRVLILVPFAVLAISVAPELGDDLIGGAFPDGSVPGWAAFSGYVVPLVVVLAAAWLGARLDESIDRRRGAGSGS